MMPWSRSLSILSLTLCLAAALSEPADGAEKVPPQIAGARLSVLDLDEAVDLYTQGLGFELLRREGGRARLRNGAFELHLRRLAPSEPVNAAGAGVHLIFQIRSLKRTLDIMGRYGARVLETRSVPLASIGTGVFLTTHDASGNLHQVIEPNPRPKLEKPALIGLELEVPDLRASREFYTLALGILPKEEDATRIRFDDQTLGTSLVLRQVANASAGGESQAALLLRSDDPAAASVDLVKRGARKLPGSEGESGRQISLHDPAGHVLVLFVADGAAPEGARGAEETGRLKLEPFGVKAPDGSTIEAELGRFSVPENRRRPQGKSIELAFLRFKSTAREPGPPIVYLAGGPGGSGIAAARGTRLPLFLALREVADVIALDQRGIGMSFPNLTCTESWTSPLDQPSDPQRMLELARQHSGQCVKAMQEAGHDLSAYNTVENADDLEDLRQALGAAKLSLLGVSYGTHLELAAIRRHEAHLHAVILAGVEGPDQVLRLPSVLQTQIAAISALVQRDKQLGSTLPDLTAAIQALLDRLERQPVSVEIDVPLANRRAAVRVGKFDLQWFVLQALSHRGGIETLPSQLLAMRSGNFDALGLFAWNIRRGWLGSAMPYAVQCASGVSPERRRRIEEERREALLGSAIDFPFPEICTTWGVPDLGAEFRSPVRAKLPALFISGTLDTRTSASDAEEVRKHFSQAAHLILAGAGHGDDLLLSTPEIGRFMVRFLQGEPVTDTELALPPLHFKP